MTPLRETAEILLPDVRVNIRGLDNYPAAPDARRETNVPRW